MKIEGRVNEWQESSHRGLICYTVDAGSERVIAEVVSRGPERIEIEMETEI